MKDRFKFRFYDKNKKIMIDENSDHSTLKATYGQDEWWWCVEAGMPTVLEYFEQQSWDGDKDFVIMQCTGLKDKNGKLIYEGDILQSEEYPFKNEKGYNYAAEVLWDDASATFYYYNFRISNNVAGRSTGNTGELNEYEDWKVIGNIYENKELLEVK